MASNTTQGDVFDVVIAAGYVVTPTAQRVSNIGISDGRIAEISERPIRGRSEVDAAGKVVLPGLVDPHVHFYVPTPEPGFLTWSDTYETGAIAAAAGGVTSVVDMVVQVQGQRASDEVDRHSLAAEQSIVDYSFHAGLTDPSQATLDEIPSLIKRGITSFKFYLTYDKWAIRVGLGFLHAAMATIARHGGVAAVHCEQNEVVTWLRDELISRGQASNLTLHESSRPSWAEEVAIRDATVVAREAGCRFYPVHVSSAKGLAAVRTGKQMIGDMMLAETAIHYLCADSRAMSTGTGALFLTTPPLRGPDDVDELWGGLLDGSLDFVASDHGPHPAEEKLSASTFDYAPDGSEYACPPGFSGTELILPLLHEFGVRRRGMSYGRLAEITSANAARALGLQGKGGIAVGLDADLVILDPELTKPVRASELHGGADHSIFEGMSLTGWPVMTLRRAEVLVDGGRVMRATTRGRQISRAPDTTRNHGETI